ncbi:LysM peptidoglycan-binding domain-containing protein [Caulobacter sp. RHG1]|uniref:cell division endopeptidase DipM n=1 Tax=Caulobacter sp. (strain RHG1) TaxID=2545762 RepID=UPI0015522552|nr:LysM peptidoglycan-binding domain-containing protein [Caulobacter sp. RHG1]NQE60369.1 LysM domain / Murein hydrolase activator NlpD [Caulobacter sp. RHG1]
MRQLWTQAAVVALTAGTLSACATSAPQYPSREGEAPAPTRTAPTPNFPITQPPVSTAPSEPSDAGATLPPPTPPVQSQPIAPVNRSDLPPPPAAQTPYQAPAPRPVAVPPRTVVTTTVTGPVVNVPGKPQVRTVESGDALDAIARGMGSTRAELVKLNDLKAPYSLKLGQKIKGPAKDDQKAYVVQTGDTMFSIAKRFSVTAAALAEENDLSSNAAIKKGQKLILPDSYKDKGPIKTTQVIPGTPAPVPSTTLAGAAPAPSRPTYQPEPAAPQPTTVSSTTTTTSVTGSVVTVAGPRQTYTVKSGDTLTAIAKRFDMSVKELADDNDLDSAKPLKLGAKIKGPATSAKAYVVGSGDTLANVGKRFSVTAKDLADENDIRVNASLRNGQRLRLPDGYRDKGPIKTTTTVTRPAPTPAAPTTTYARAETPAPAPAPTPTPSAPIPYTAVRPNAPVVAQPVTPPPAASRPIIESSAAPTEAEIIASGKGRFAWPVRGEIISSFGVKGTGQRNDGLDIRAAQGTPVVAAADGEVAYAGNQVPAFGNLVLVKHADGWVTAYAHLSSTAVKMRQQVRQGEQLGAVGQTGGASEPKLHFEMRYAPTAKDKAKPVDPSLVLPR